jgi:YHS domain-containing protein
MDLHRDPHCGNLVSADRGFTFTYQGREYHFCSEACLRDFKYEHPR